MVKRLRHLERTDRPVARSEFHREVAVASSPEETWKVITTVPVVVGWVDVVENAVEIEHLSKYTAVLMDRLGPFKLRADLDIDIFDVVVGESLSGKASGEDRQVGSRLSIEGSVSLKPREPSGTVVTVSGSYEVSGKVASMGSGTINKKAEKIMEEFFATAVSALGQV
jgi:carbon monoxide dehydrogenase subunit G